MIKLNYTFKITIIGTILLTITTLFLSSIEAGQIFKFLITFIPLKLTPDFGTELVATNSIIIFLLLLIIQNAIISFFIGYIVDFIRENKKKSKK